MKSRNIKTRLAAFGLALLMGLSPLGNLADVHAAESEISQNAVTEKEDGLIIEGNSAFKYAQCDSHDDHRIAMALAVAGASGKGVKISGADCVNISYPQFYTTLEHLK